YEAQPSQDATFSVLAAGTSVQYQWWKDGLPVPQANEPSLTLRNLQTADRGSYTVVVSNQYGSVTSAVAMLTLNLISLDPAFYSSAPGAATFPISALAGYDDRKLLVGGGVTNCCLSRLNVDGTLDPSFNVNANAAPDYQVYSLSVQDDGRILMGKMRQVTRLNR